MKRHPIRWFRPPDGWQYIADADADADADVAQRASDLQPPKSRDRTLFVARVYALLFSVPSNAAPPLEVLPAFRMSLSIGEPSGMMHSRPGVADIEMDDGSLEMVDLTAEEIEALRLLGSAAPQSLTARRDAYRLLAHLCEHQLPLTDLVLNALGLVMGVLDDTPSISKDTLRRILHFDPERYIDVLNAEAKSLADTGRRLQMEKYAGGVLEEVFGDDVDWTDEEEQKAIARLGRSVRRMRCTPKFRALIENHRNRAEAGRRLAEKEVGNARAYDKWRMGSPSMRERALFPHDGWADPLQLQALSDFLLFKKHRGLAQQQLDWLWSLESAHPHKPTLREDAAAVWERLSASERRAIREHAHLAEVAKADLENEKVELEKAEAEWLRSLVPAHPLNEVTEAQRAEIWEHWKTLAKRGSH